MIFIFRSLDLDSSADSDEDMDNEVMNEVPCVLESEGIVYC